MRNNAKNRTLPLTGPNKEAGTLVTKQPRRTALSQLRQLWDTFWRVITHTGTAVTFPNVLCLVAVEAS